MNTDAVAEGQLWWADLPRPVGSALRFRSPVLVVQGDDFDRSTIGTVMVVPLTSNLVLAQAAGNVLLIRSDTGLPKDSVANVSQIVSIDRDLLSQLVSTVDHRHLDLVLSGIDLVFGR